MDEAALTVADLLPGDFKVDPGQLRLGEGDSLKAPGIGDFISAKLRESIGAALEVDVIELIAEAWAQMDELRKVASARKPPSADPDTVYLLKHEVVCENKLKVALEFAGMPALTDHLELKLTARFEGVGLTIDSGHVVAIEAGRGSAKVELLYSNARIAGESSDWVALPAKLTLRRPIRIAPAGSGEVVPIRERLAA